jgi:guanylate kinase
MFVLGIGGQKGVGKTTLIRNIINDNKHERLVLYESRFGSIPAIKIGNSFIIGNYKIMDDKFSGTDRLSMSVIVPFKDWLLHNKDKNINVIFEGDRLYNQSLKDFLVSKKIKHKFYVLTAPKEQIEKQIKKRGHTENPLFVKSRITKYVNMLKSNRDIETISQKPLNEILRKLIQ